MLRTSALKVLGPEDLVAARELVDRDPATHVFVASRLHASGMESWRLGGELWGWFDGSELTSLAYSGANLVPVEAGPAAIAAFADRARRQGRRCSSLVGPADQLMELWRQLEPSWGPARSVRPRQPLMTISTPPLITPDPLVRRVTEDEIDVLLPACVQMFTEEVGVSPIQADGGRMYRARVAELVRSGRAFARIEDGEVLFKAEIGAASAHACQVQGVWVAPEHRGRGLSEPGTAAVVELARRDIAPLVTLYVNDYNAIARSAYRKVGLVEAGTFASVLF
jgi:predicted GNAT family acetyltransferase